MRGKQCNNEVWLKWDGITPADAGKTGTVGISAVGMEDHPRGCGENASRSAAAQSRAGSPPRMRGKPCRCGVHAAATGITPADAGKTCRLSSNPRCNEDHPRGCGENLRQQIFMVKQSGSPPRMRGKLKYIFKIGRKLRITPADAGKTAI